MGTAGQTADIGFKTADQALREKEMNQRVASEQAQIQQKNAVLLQELQRTYMDARLQLETTPNLDGPAKARAIGAMADHYNQVLLPELRTALGDPAAWPTASSTAIAANPALAPAAAAPAPPPPPPPAPPPAPEYWFSGPSEPTGGA